MNPGEKLPYIVLPAMMIAVQIGALLLSGTMVAAGMAAFEDPTSVYNIVYFVAILLVFTAILLVLIRYGVQRVISIIIGFSIFAALCYIYGAVALALLDDGVIIGIITLVAAAGSTALLMAHPEWYVLDTLGVLIAAGIASIFGISFAQFPVIVLLVVLAIYDALSVYRTKHMVTLAEGVLKIKSPILVVVPRRKDYSYVREGVSLDDDRRGAVVMGMGDLIMPTMLVVSAYVYGMPSPGAQVPVIGAAIGSLAGLAMVMYFLRRGKPQAGLPPLNGGAIGGFLIGCALVGAWGWIPGM